MDAALVAHLWQSTLCAMVAWSITLALREHSARTRYFIWLAASLKFLIPFSALVSLGLKLRPSSPVGIEFLPAPLIDAALSLAEPSAKAGEASSAVSLFGAGVGTIVLALWAAGFLVVTARWVISWVRTRAAVRTAEPCSMDVPIDVRVSAAFAEPGVFGIREPILLLPRDALSRMSSAELSAVVAHEMCHVRHRDNLAAAVHMFVEAVFWFHPMVWWIGGRLLEERERACDETVIELGAARRTYAEGILKACRVAIESKLGVVAGASGASLRQRIVAIVSERPSRRLNALGKSGLVAIAASALVLPVSAGFATPRPPGWGAAFSAAAPLHFASVFIATTSDSQVEPWLTVRDGKLSMRNVSLRKLVSVAYETGERQVFGGPAWLDERYDIEATTHLGRDAAVAGEASSAAQRQVIIALLAEKFGLKFIAWTSNAR